MSDKTLHRLTLRQLLTSSDKTTHEVAEVVYEQLLPCVHDFHELTRPNRRKSHYPTMVAFQNSVRRLVEAHDRLQAMIGVLQEHLDAIHDHAQREKVNRKPNQMRQ